MLQVHQFSNKQTEMALRVASLDYLGTVASRLRKDAVNSNMDQKTIDRILKEVDEMITQLLSRSYINSGVELLLSCFWFIDFLTDSRQ